VRAYFILAGELGTEGLVPYLFEVPKTQAVARAAMEKLLAGSTVQRDGYAAISSAIPPGTRLLGLSISGGIATVDLSGEFEAGGGSRSTLARLGQVVYTLTQFSTVDAVAFEVDGEPVTVFGSEGLVIHGPMVRAAFEDVLPAIFVDRPAFGAALANLSHVTGTSNNFEATFRIAILDGNGRVLSDGMAMATSGSGTRGTFDVVVQYNVGRAQWGTLRVYEPSAQDGSPIFVRDYPVWLTPGG
jgi:germination protein M